MTKGRVYAFMVALVGGLVAVVATPRNAAAKCWYEGTTFDQCNGVSCPGGWCCKICDKT